jgi:hypothetical protein
LAAGARVARRAQLDCAVLSDRAAEGYAALRPDWVTINPSSKKARD